MKARGETRARVVQRRIWITAGLVTLTVATGLALLSLESVPAPAPFRRGREEQLRYAIEQGRAAVAGYRAFRAKPGGSARERAAQLMALQAAMDSLNRVLDSTRDHTSLVGSLHETPAEQVMGSLAECLIELERGGRARAAPTPGHGVGASAR